VSTNLAVELAHWFCDLATQYYVAGRLAARGGLVPVHGNLFHHAIEMYLKATLVGTRRFIVSSRSATRMRLSPGAC
jgi:hypothetical protein